MKTFDQFLEPCRRVAIESELARPGEQVVLTAGVPLHIPGNTNLLKVLEP